MVKKISSVLCLSAASLSLFAGCGKAPEDKSVTTPENIKRTTRSAMYPVDKLILHRWSSRAFSGEPISDDQLMTLFEAARWAPSAYNNQPWRFIYAKPGTPAWDTFFNLLVDFNKKWTHNAAALVVVVSQEKTTEKDHPIPTHSFDTGAAWQNIALQATSMGLVAHGMSGFDYAKAKEVLHIPEGYTVEAMFAVGKPGKVSDLPEQLQAGELTQSNRNPIEAFAYEGVFPDQTISK